MVLIIVYEYIKEKKRYNSSVTKTLSHFSGKNMLLYDNILGFSLKNTYIPIHTHIQTYNVCVCAYSNDELLPYMCIHTLAADKSIKTLL